MKAPDLPQVDPQRYKDLVDDWQKVCGLRVRDLRTRLGFDTCRSLADAVGCNPVTIYRIETGDLLPRDYWRLAIANVLGVNADDLWPTLRHHDVLTMLGTSEGIAA